MKILIISQVFWPDETAGSQILTDLAEALAASGLEVDVITSRTAYENEKTLFAREETYKGIHIKRLRTSFFGKSSKLGRIINFLLFNTVLFVSLLFKRKGSYVLVLSLSSPPLIAFFGITAARIKGIPFLFWAMDLQPELAIASGYVKEKGVLTRLLWARTDRAYRKSDLVVALDKYMADHIRSRGGRADRIEVIPVWDVMPEPYAGKRLDNPFRVKHGFADKIVVMYSGNHSVIHPLDTLLHAALELRDDPRFLFAFVGGGIRKKDVSDFASEHQLSNIVQLPHQPRETIHLSLSSADLHAVVLGNGCAGYTHPSKIYGMMAIGRPVLYVGPKESYITDLLAGCPGNIAVEHGEGDALARQLRAFADSGADQWSAIGRRNLERLQKHFSKEKSAQHFVSRIKTLMAAHQSKASSTRVELPFSN